jgi:hypothetical protein
LLFRTLSEFAIKTFARKLNWNCRKSFSTIQIDILYIIVCPISIILKQVKVNFLYFHDILKDMDINTALMAKSIIKAGRDNLPRPAFESMQKVTINYLSSDNTPCGNWFA